MPKQKNTELNFLYMNEEDNKKDKKKKNKGAGQKSVPKKKDKKNNTKSVKKKKAKEDKDETFDFDNEIVIGVTIPKEPTKEKNKKKKKAQVKHKDDKANLKNKSFKEKKKKNKPKNLKKSLAKRVIKWGFVIAILITATILFLMSPVFNITEVQVSNNKKVNKDTIVSLSKIKLGENIYKITTREIRKNIKENAYIEDVTVKRKLPNIVELDIKEREATYMLEYANSYAYINNQGYILEISENKLDVPIIVGYFTKEKDMQAGSRLSEEDLERIQTVLKIMETANSNSIGGFITRINIENKQNYILIMEEKGKTVYLGDATNLSNRILYLKAILLDQEGVNGEIFLNMDLNKEKVFFRKQE